MVMLCAVGLLQRRPRGTSSSGAKEPGVDVKSVSVIMVSWFQVVFLMEACGDKGNHILWLEPEEMTRKDGQMMGASLWVWLGWRCPVC